MQASRSFHDTHPVYVQLLRRALASPVLRETDEAHMAQLGEAMADALEAAFYLPPQPDLARRLSLMVITIDRIWGYMPLENGRISNFCFEESRRMAVSYLANYLPAYLTPRSSPTRETHP